VINHDFYYVEQDKYGVPEKAHAYLIDSIDLDNNKVILLNPHGVKNVMLPRSELSNVLGYIFILPKP
jgi:hypothetical protein